MTTPEETRNQGRCSRSHVVDANQLRRLRAAHGRSQEEAAERAGVTDRLIRKAEAGKPIEVRSIARIAAAFSTSENPIAPGDLLARYVNNTNCRHLKSWLDQIWNQRKLDAIDELADPEIEFHCEKGLLLGRDLLRQRLRDIQSLYDRFEAWIEQLDDQGDVVVCRWRMTITLPQPDRRPNRPRNHSFPCLTLMRFLEGRIVEGWEFWDPQVALRQAMEHRLERRS
jgi:transcriptional regulator with XRE-family HTH domain